MNTRRNQFNVVALAVGCYEFVLAMFILVQIFLALLVFEIAKFLPIGWPFSWHRRRVHNSFCAGHFPPFSPCRQRESGQFLAGGPVSTRFSRGSDLGRALSNDSTSRRVTNLNLPRKAGFGNQKRSPSFSSSCRRKHRQDCASTSESCAAGQNGSVDGELCQCIAPSLDLYDDLIEVSAEYLKQKDRGHEEVILSLLKALQVERRSLRALYEELEEERVASETAANEAMSMILRLQKEKSALQIKADHYQRIAEERAIHDENAIQLLEEELCTKENERLLLEEELIELRNMAYLNNNGCDMTEPTEQGPEGSVMAKCLLRLTDGAGKSWRKVDEAGISVVQTLGSGDSQCVTLSKEHSFEEFPFADIALKRLRHVTQYERTDGPKDLLVLHENVESTPLEPNEADDTEVILNQLNVVEKQLIALEESEKLESWQQARASHDSVLNKFLSPDSCTGLDRDSKGDLDYDSQMQMNTPQTSEADDASTMFDEERVVKVDVANVISGSFSERQTLVSEDIFEIHENENGENKGALCEVSEEEKHLDLLSCVKKSDSIQGIASLVEGSIKLSSEEENWSKRRITLEGINLRLQALESESTILRHRSVPSNHEHVNLVSLHEIMQELQDLLKANKNITNG